MPATFPKIGFLFICIHTFLSNKQNTSTKNKNYTNDVENRCTDTTGFWKGGTLIIFDCYINNAR